MKYKKKGEKLKILQCIRENINQVDELISDHLSIRIRDIYHG